ncbi:hypothetical protein DY000_02056625 [Brassica cretica]|uniref:Protein kinase domain-containing protein n=1 Tax=Brassica cretica TaxID=69181 RepID=A0ABQ7AB83_BRACR|nr:hypothetical protein DY000_02056625 [Brassica cretica]
MCVKTCFETTCMDFRIDNGDADGMMMTISVENHNEMGESSGQAMIEQDDDENHNEIGENSNQEMPLEQDEKVDPDSIPLTVSDMAEEEVQGGDEPYVGQEFESEAAAHGFYNAYATKVGFVIRVSKLSRSRHDGSPIGRQLVCNKEGYRLPSKRDKVIRQRAETRVGCRAMILIRKENSGKWVITKFAKEHNHPLMPGRVRRDKQKNSNEFRTELDLLSRLNHAHLLSLLGYCEEGGERLLVYEFMAHGSLYNHLHGKNKALKEQLDWVKRVTIAVQAARGIEYLHGYACPPVIHRDIKSSNILIDEEHNARVADFGLSLLGPVDSGSPLAELPAGTLGYLDPEYYRLHYLTTKSDVYSFGVLLLEILSGRKAIDMHYEEGNIVEWAVPLIKAGDITSILDPVLKQPTEIEALRRIVSVACKCVRMRGKDRPSMDKVTTSLERALAQLMGNPSSEQPILPTEVVLGSSRMHKKSWRIGSENTEFRGGSWITFPSVTSSQRRKSSASEGDVVEEVEDEGRKQQEALRSLEEEIGPASPGQSLFLHHNF